MSDGAKVRVEWDSLGAVEVPADALWGIHTARSIDALSFSGRTLAGLPDLRRALGLVKVAAARANHAAGVLPSPEASAIEAAGRALAGGGHDDALVSDPFAGGGAIAVHANVNEVLANVANLALGAPRGSCAPVHPKLSVSASQSTADVVHTAGRLAILDAADRAGAAAARLSRSVREAAARAGDAPTLARTCLQDGLEVEARLLFDGSATALARARRALDVAAAPLHEVVLGGTVVGTGSGAPGAYRAVVVDELARCAGRPVARCADPASALQHGDDLLAVAEAGSRLAIVAAKLARDLRLLASGPHGGFGEVSLPAVMEGSSFFAGKVNPAVPETVVQAAALVAGHRRTVEAAAGQAELHLHVFDLTAVVAVLDLLGIVERAFDRFTLHCIDGLVFDEDRGRQLAAFAAFAGSDRPTHQVQEHG